MPTCEDLMVRILSKDPRALDEASEHIAACPQCRQRLATLLSHSRSDEPDLMPCAECSARLPEYMVATPEVLAANPELLAVRAHLRSCETCRQEWADMQATLDVIPRPRRIVNSMLQFISSGQARTRKIRGGDPRITGPGLAVDAARSAAHAERRALELDFRPEMDFVATVGYVRQDGHFLITVRPLFAQTKRPALGAYIGLYLDGVPSRTFYIDAGHSVAEFRNVIPSAHYALRIEFEGSEGMRALDLPNS